MPPMMSVNGAIFHADEAFVPALDAGIQHGVGLFETLTGGVGPSGPWVLGLEQHLHRLKVSADELGLSRTLDLRAIGMQALKAMAAAAEGEPRDASDFRIRITLTGGDTNMLKRRLTPAQKPGAESATAPTSNQPGEPLVLVSVQPAIEYPPELFERGIAVVIAGFRANPLDPTQGHKTLNYWQRLRELREAATKRSAEALVFQITNALAGGCVSNCIVVRGDQFITPIARGEEKAATEAGASPPTAAAPAQSAEAGVWLPSPVLPGVVRAWALDWAESRGLDVERRNVAIDDLLKADEVLLTNSGWGVVPVVKIEREAIADATPGEYARALRESWLDRLALERNSG
jgi:branched-chain amino acid aminotransferase